MLAGLVASFLLIIAGAVAMLFPTGIAPDSSVVAIPTDVKAGTLVKYKINGCEEGKYRGVTSVNIQTTDTPPSITVAVAAPSAQAIHCQNVILIPAPVPTGDYRILVFISYGINPVRDLLNPERRQYTSNTIHVTNENPIYKLPEAIPQHDQPLETPVMHQTAQPVPQESPQIASQPTQEAPQPQHTQSAVQPQPEPQKSLVDSVLNTVDNTFNTLLGVRG